MLTPQNLHDYQRECVMHQLTCPQSMLWLQMGLGKTPITLTSIVDRMRMGQVKKTLIFGPLRVIQSVWHREAVKWSHTQHLRFSIVHGTKEKRLRALFANADVYLINYEAMNWLAETLDHYYLSQGKPLPFQMVVYDEVSKLKNSTALRMAGGNRDRKDKHGTTHKIRVTGWRKIIPHIPITTGLTGTPASNGYLDLHGQYLAVDGGARLGEYVTGFKDRYFESDYMGWSYSPTDSGKKRIEELIGDITKKMDAADYLDMPAVKTTNLMVDLPPKVRQHYAEIERDLFTRLDTGTEIELFSKTSVSNKLLQMVNGSPYLLPESSDYEAVHDTKLDALEDVIEEAAGSPVLCSYSFKSDAERIMKRFKKYKPVNLTATKSSDTGRIIDDWNSGKTRLIIGHPACLHPDTKVLTERHGWIRMIDVKSDDRVHDGVEFVNHAGVTYSGFKNVTDLFGITMTHNHKLLINDEWVTAADVRNNKTDKSEAVYKWEETTNSHSEMSPVRCGKRNASAECDKAQQTKINTLSDVCERQVSPHDKHPYMAHLVRTQTPVKGHIGPQLRWSWDQFVQRMGIIRNILRRYERRIFGRSNDRTCGCEWPLLQKKLQMGDQYGAAVEQKDKPLFGVSRGSHSSCGTGAQNRCKQNDVNYEAEPRNDCGTSGAGCERIEIREKSESSQCKTQRKAHVYDIVNCGPRHRFLIQNDDGDVFMSHNSMGHGIDGLQLSGHIVVWFGVNWSLELYEQMNGRIDRQGQKHPVSIVRILCRDSIDLAVADAIERKTDDQNGLKAALQRYRDGITDNDLTVNFF